LWLSNFVTVAEANDAILELSAEDIFKLTTDTTGFDTRMTALESAKNAQKAATGAKNTSKTTISTFVRGLARKFKANPNVSDELLLALGVVNSNSAGPVVTVTGVDVQACDDGVNTVKFERTGNSPQTTFIIEYKTPSGTDWLFGDAITRTTWNHEGQTPGQQIWYRITSARAGQRSAPSVPVAAYPNTSSNPLSVAA
jgi:hypothetical protein